MRHASQSAASYADGLVQTGAVVSVGDGNNDCDNPIARLSHLDYCVLCLTKGLKSIVNKIQVVSGLY